MTKKRRTDFPLFEETAKPGVPPAIRQQIVEVLGELLVQIVLAEEEGGEDESQA